MRRAVAAVLAIGALGQMVAARTPAQKTLSKAPHHVFHASQSVGELESCLRPKVGQLPGNLVTTRAEGRTDYLIQDGMWVVSLIAEQGGSRIEERQFLLPLRGINRIIEDCGGALVVP